MIEMLVTTAMLLSASMNGQSLPDLRPHDACKDHTTDLGKVSCLNRQIKDLEQLKRMWNRLDVGIKQSCGGHSTYSSMSSCVKSILDIDKDVAGFKLAKQELP
jgi:hypothetical protein